MEEERSRVRGEGGRSEEGERSRSRMEGGRKSARQRFLRRTRALTLTISIPSMLVGEGRSKQEKPTPSSSLLKRSQSSREVWRGRRSASEHCLAREEEVVGLGRDYGGTTEELRSCREEGVEGEGGLGYRLKRSLTVSHILDNFHRSFRVKRSQSQREVRPKKNKTRYGGRRLEAESHLVAGTQEDECWDVCLCSMVGVCV